MSLMVTLPAEAVSSASGTDLMPSFSASMSNVPPFMVTLPSAAMPLFAALTW